VTLCHQSLRYLAWWGDLPTSVHVGRGIWDASPSATLVTDASIEGWGAVLHAQTGKENTPSGAAPQTRAGVHRTFGTCVPARGPFIPPDAEPTSINQRWVLTAIFGLKTFLSVARQQRVQLLSDSQVALAVIRNWTCRSPRVIGPPSDSAATLRGKRDFFGPAIHTQRPEHLGRQVEPQPSLFRLGAHPFFPRPNTKPSISPSQHHPPHPSLRPSGHRGPGRPPLPLSHRHGKRGSSWKTTATTGWPNAMAYRDGTHPRHPHASTSRTRPSAPTSSPVGRRRRRPRLAGATLAPAVHAGRRDYDIAGEVRVASRETQRKYHTTRTLVGGAPSRLQPKALCDVCRQAGYYSGLTRFGRSPEGRSAAFLRGSQRSVSFGTRTRSNDVVRLQLQVGTISRLLWH
jgi:hypothetical protein